MSATELFIVGVLITVIVTAAMALLVYAAILDGRDEAGSRVLVQNRPPAGATNIVETARTAGECTTLVTAIHQAGLAELLIGGGPYTVFAPNDKAFARLPDGAVDSLLAAPETLADVVGYHVVPGHLTTADVARQLSAETVQGEALTISSRGEVRVDGAHVVRGDIEAANGVVHIIDRVLLPARI